MQAIVGIFPSIQDARLAGQAVFAAVPSARVRLVSPSATAGELDTLPADDAEQPGIGAALGGVVGGAVGGAVATLIAPPVGLAAIAGIAGGALLGAGGGAIAGDAFEEALSYGMPKDELMVYEEALRRGRALVMAVVDESEQADAARKALAEAGAESVDAAREDWSVGLHSEES